MSYVDASFDRDNDVIKIVERNEHGVRVYKEYPTRYTFYHDDPRGKFTSIYGDTLTRIVCKNSKDFRKEVAINSGKKLYESDINPVFSTLSEHYLNRDAPKLNICFFDIEVDFDPERGYADPSDPFMPITAITVYLKWIEQLITLALPPKTMTMEQAKEAVKEFPNTHLYDNEGDMLGTFLGLLQDADIISGWNSEGYDVPYTVNRVTRVLSKEDTRQFCLWNQFPKKREFEKYGRQLETYDFVGRVHLDSLELYRKYTYEERHTYRLDAIGELEIGENKTVYEGSLDQLYNNDFRKFIEYNRQDVLLLNKLDDKLQFIELANKLAHECTVLLQTTMGAVAVTEQAIINEAHRRGFQVPNRPKFGEGENTAAAGAYVAYPKEGLQDWVGSLDINSLYPSAIRALNMGPETIVGQLRPTYTDNHIHEQTTLKKKSFAAAWEGMFGSIEYAAVMEQRRDTEIHIDWEDGETTVHSAAEVYKLVFDSNQPWMLSANGTIFTHETEAVIPGLLKRWYAERQDMQVKLKECTIPEDEEYWDKRQLVKKINLNSLYGAILNPGCRFFDKRIGQSTTLTGRAIAQHMDAYVNECITGRYEHVGEAIIYGDTDSCYFSAWPAVRSEVEQGRMTWSKETCIALYDSIADQVNLSFPAFMEQAFHCPRDLGTVIRGGREIVASRGLFITKKRYAVMIIDKEGRRTDVNGQAGKVKAMGLDLKRSDTPKIIQDFLSEVLDDVLTGKVREEVINKIREFKYAFAERPGWEKGSPKRVNNLTVYGNKEAREGRTNMPGHVRAAINWNTMRKMNADNYSMQIMDGMKVIVCKLKPNPLEWTSIAYPTDELHLPQWFRDLPFDDAAMQTTVIDGKITNLLGVLAWDLESATRTDNTFESLFEF